MQGRLAIRTLVAVCAAAMVVACIFVLIPGLMNRSRAPQAPTIAARHDQVGELEVLFLPPCRPLSDVDVEVRVGNGVDFDAGVVVVTSHTSTLPGGRLTLVLPAAALPIEQWDWVLVTADFVVNTPEQAVNAPERSEDAGAEFHPNELPSGATSEGSLAPGEFQRLWSACGT